MSYNEPQSFSNLQNDRKGYHYRKYETNYFQLPLFINFNDRTTTLTYNFFITCLNYFRKKINFNMKNQILINV